MEPWLCQKLLIIGIIYAKSSRKVMIAANFSRTSFEVDVTGFARGIITTTATIITKYHHLYHHYHHI